MSEAILPTNLTNSSSQITASANVIDGHRSGEFDFLSVGKRDIIFFALAAAFVYTQLFQFPFTPYYFDGDGLIPISNALRLLDGEVMYRDFFHITPPGTEIWYSMWFWAFGPRVWIPNLSILFLNLALIWLTLYFSRQLLSGWIIYLAPAVLMIFGLRLFFVDGSYRLFSIIPALASVAVLMRSRTSGALALAGGLCGLSSFFVQTRGITALAGIGLYLFWEYFRTPRNERRFKSLARPWLILGLSFCVTVAATQAYFAVSAGFDNYYFSLVTFVREYYSSDPLSNESAFLADVPSLSQLLTIYSPVSAISRFVRISAPTLFFYLVVPWSYIAFLAYRWRRKANIEEPADRRLILLCFVGLTMAAGISAPSGFRLSHVSIPAIVIIVCLIARTRYTKFAPIALLACGLLGVAYTIQRQTVSKYYLDMPGGRAAFFSELVFNRYAWIGKHTTSGDRFYEGHHPSFYFPFQLKNPTPMYLLRNNDYTPQFQVDSVLRSLQAAPPEYIAWPKKWSKPASERSAADHLEELWQFLQANYESVFVFEKPPDYTPNSEGDIEIWRRKAH